ncbi:MAG: Xaa-Pro peptidase family protein [Pseudomonadota bacterium]
MLVREKVKQAKELLKEFNIDCWITFVRESKVCGDPMCDYVVGKDMTWHSAFVITKAGKTYAIVGKYEAKIVEETQAYDNVIGYVEGIKKDIQDLIKEINPGTIALNYSEGSYICDGITHGMFLTMKSYLSEIGFEDRIVSADKIISALRGRKSDFEIDNIKKAVDHTVEIYDELASYMKSGMTENDVRNFILEKISAKNLPTAWDQESCPAVYSGPDTAEAHYKATDRIIEPGHVVNMDFGVKYNDYCSDIQRTYYIRKEGEDKAPEDVQKAFDLIRKVVDDAKNAMKPGVKGIEIDTLVRTKIVEAGYPEYPHGLGHQVGRFSHDGNALLGPAWEKYAQQPFLPLEAGMVFTIEPRVTVEGKGVVTIEEMVVVTEDGCEWLSKPQIELYLV